MDGPKVKTEKKKKKSNKKGLDMYCTTYDDALV
jgi:hypothetical protein